MPYLKTTKNIKIFTGNKKNCLYIERALVDATLRHLISRPRQQGSGWAVGVMPRGGHSVDGTASTPANITY
jgi:hypothetical protein